ncbi:Folic acid synthesis protein fol1 [Talaromyces pinophilus]|nr:Folic acid synthesis protein fol1 [Talaromyces pinophilus]
MAGHGNLRPATRPSIVDNVSLRNINLHFPAAPDPWHRSGKSQPCTAAVKLSYSSAVAAANADDVSLSLDYGKLYRRIETAVRDSTKSQDGGRLSIAAEATISNDVRVIAGLIANCGLGLLDETIAGVRRMDHLQAHPESPSRRRASQASRRLSGVSASVPKELQSATSPEVLNGMFGECEVLLHLPNAHLRAEGGLSFRTVQTWVYADDSASLENVVESSRQVAIMEQEFRVEGIRCHCILGVNSHERIEKQAVIITLDFRGSGEAAWASTFLNTYQEMVRTIAERVENTSYQTVEALATSIARTATMDFGNDSVTVLVEKPSALAFVERAGVQVTRSKAFFAEQDFSRARGGL